MARPRCVSSGPSAPRLAASDTDRRGIILEAWCAHAMWGSAITTVVVGHLKRMRSALFEKTPSPRVDQRDPPNRACARPDRGGRAHASRATAFVSCAAAIGAERAANTEEQRTHIRRAGQATALNAAAHTPLRRTTATMVLSFRVARSGGMGTRREPASFVARSALVTSRAANPGSYDGHLREPACILHARHACETRRAHALPRRATRIRHDLRPR